MIEMYMTGYRLVYWNIVYILYQLLPIIIVCIMLVLFFYFMKVKVSNGD